MAKRGMGAGTGIGVGIALGVALGAAFGNIGLGLALGVAFGAALDWHGRDSHDGDDANPEEPPISNGDADDGSVD